MSVLPDVTAVVGSGKNKKELKCYGVILAAASPVLDAMLSSGMKERFYKDLGKPMRIEFPDKNSDDFELFMECIDPTGGILSRTNKSWEYCDLETLKNDEDNEEEQDSPMLNESNVRSVAPLFHEFQMEAYLNKCDVILHSVYSHSKWNDIESMNEKLELLAFAIKYDLERTQCHVQTQIERLLERFCWGCGDANVFDITTVEKIVDICRPLNLVERKPPAKKSKKTRCQGSNKGSYESSTCKNLWAQISSCIEDDLSLLPTEEINGGNTLSRMVFFALQRYHKAMKAEFELKSAALIGKSKCYLKIGIEGLSTYDSKINIGGWRQPSVTRTLLGEAVDEAISNAVPFDAEVGNFCRSYELSEAQDVISMFFEPSLKKTKTAQASDSMVKATSSSDLRSYSPDLIVKVGSGKDAEEFECHEMLLVFASAKLEELICSSNGRLLLPHIDRDTWEDFCECIRSNGWCHLNVDNVHALTPLFQEFEMQYYLERSICIMEDWHYDFDSDRYEDSLQDIIDCLTFAAKLGFTNVQQKAERVISGFFKDDQHGDVLKKIDVHAMKDLVSVCLPVQRNSAEEPFSSQTAPTLWKAIVSYPEEYQLKSLSFDKVQENDLEMFSNLIYQMVYFVAHENERLSHY